MDIGIDVIGFQAGSNHLFNPVHDGQKQFTALSDALNLFRIFQDNVILVFIFILQRNLRFFVPAAIFKFFSAAAWAQFIGSNGR
jgi:hypothetical protein